MQKEEKVPMNAMDKILLILGIATGIFTIAMIIVFCVFQTLPETLVERYFTCVVGEGGFMALIKIAKTVTSKPESTEETDTNEFDGVFDVTDDLMNLFGNDESEDE